MKIEEIISNVRVYDLEESMVASGYPMRTEAKLHELTPSDEKRATNLVEATKDGNQGHGQFLTGIRVNFDLTLTNKCWVEAERYNFLDFISSQSTMHRITKFDLDKQYIKYTDRRIIEIMKEKVAEYLELLNNKPSLEEVGEKGMKEYNNKLSIKYLEILYSNPAGFRLTARMTTNYRCLRNIYIQRKDHRLPEWRAFCKWIESLPYADQLLTNINKEGKK